MGRKEPDRKAIDEMDRIQRKYGGRRPEYITMLFAERLNCLTKALIALTAILAMLTVVHVYLLLR
ncbi:hypothetical protein ACFLV4_05525 [Chloroflexota bacterium]